MLVKKNYHRLCAVHQIFKAGVKVIVALPGSRIAGNVKIKKGEIRGQVSNGMICSLQELGYRDSVIAEEGFWRRKYFVRKMPLLVSRFFRI